MYAWNKFRIAYLVALVVKAHNLCTSIPYTESNISDRLSTQSAPNLYGLVPVREPVPGLGSGNV